MVNNKHIRRRLILLWLIILLVNTAFSCVTIYTNAPSETPTKTEISNQESDHQTNQQIQPSAQKPLQEPQVNHESGWNAVQAEPSINFLPVNSDPFPGEYLDDEDNSGIEQLEIKPQFLPPPTLINKTFIGSMKSKEYHYPGCNIAQKIPPVYEIWFSSANEAKSAGYKSCKFCNPP